MAIMNPTTRTYVRALLAGTLAVFNAVIFPLWTGYAGGAQPLPAGIAAAAPYLVVALVNAGALIALKRSAGERGIQARRLLLLALCTRLLYLAARALQGATAVDQDVELYFGYGRELIAGHYPMMEYPQGGLLLFAGAYLLAAGDLARFRLMFPLTMLPFELLTLGAWLWLGRRYAAERTSSALGLFYAISPFTLVLWYGKYDAAPAALLACGIVLFAAGRRTLSALALACGFLTKWFPGIAIAVLALALLRARTYQAAFKYAAVAAAAVVIPLAGCWLIAPDQVVFTYTTHLTRPIMGESLPYIPAYFLDPGARLPPGIAPWNDLDSSPLSNSTATALSLAAVGLVLILSAARRAQPAATITFAGLSVAAFILANRVFSPQYILVLIAAYALGFIALSPGHPGAAWADLLLLALTGVNYLIWPVWSGNWFALSVAFFTLNVLTVLVLGYWCLRLPAQTAAAPAPAA
jgi:hypothetical protein